MNEELKPCPFCGRSALWLEASTEKVEDVEGQNVYRHKTAIKCVNCHAQGGVYYLHSPVPYIDKANEPDMKAGAIEAWNRRTSE